MDAENIMRVLPVSLRNLFGKLDMDTERLQEIRLRIGKPVAVVCGNREYFVGVKGSLLQKPEFSYVVTGQDLKESMEYISNYSMYAFEEELRQGFITIQGGHRVGVAGKAIVSEHRILSLRHISFINIRVSHEVKGCADEIMPYIVKGDKVFPTLIISPPGCGKTTLLRDVIRQISDGEGNGKGKNVGVVDERSELGACYMGVPQNDLGIRTDILDCCPKAEGIMMMVRSMSPEVIAVDEIGSREDMEAIEHAMNCGCVLMATVHGENMEDVREKPILGEQIKQRMFQRYIVLSGAMDIGTVEEIFDERGCLLYNAKKLS